MDDGTHGYRVGCLQEQVRQLQGTFLPFLFTYLSRDTVYRDIFARVIFDLLHLQTVSPCLEFAQMMQL